MVPSDRRGQALTTCFEQWTIEVDGEKELVRTQLPLQLAWCVGRIFEG